MVDADPATALPVHIKEVRVVELIGSVEVGRSMCIDPRPVEDGFAADAIGQVSRAKRRGRHHALICRLVGMAGADAEAAPPRTCLA